MLPLDDSAEVIAPDGSKLKSGIIYGKSGYFQGVSGKALEVKRHAYDQATALNFRGASGNGLERGYGFFLV